MTVSTLSPATSLWRGVILINATSGRAGKLFFTGPKVARYRLPRIITGGHKEKKGKRGKKSGEGKKCSKENKIRAGNKEKKKRKEKKKEMYIC